MATRTQRSSTLVKLTRSAIASDRTARDLLTIFITWSNRHAIANDAADSVETLKDYEWRAAARDIAPSGGWGSSVLLDTRTPRPRDGDDAILRIAAYNGDEGGASILTAILEFRSPVVVDKSRKPITGKSPCGKPFTIPHTKSDDARGKWVIRHVTQEFDTMIHCIYDRTGGEIAYANNPRYAKDTTHTEPILIEPRGLVNLPEDHDKDKRGTLDRDGKIDRTVKGVYDGEGR